MKLSEIAKVLEIPCEAEQEIAGVGIDSRMAMPQQMFVALKGEHVDGHDYVLQAIEHGAVAILAERDLVVKVPVLVVDNAQAALTKIACHHRQTLNLKVLALTGSNGKTTVKDMLGCIFQEHAFVSKGNFNNQLGVPINLMALNETHHYAVFELGANHVGDIQETARMVKPDIALINNIGPAHLGKFGSIEQVAKAKGEIYEQLSSSGIAIVNDDDFYAHYWDDLFTHLEVLRFSSQHPADIWASDIQEHQASCYQFKLHFGSQTQEIILSVPGRHQVQNALAAASMALAAGLSLLQIQKGFASFSGVKGRLNFKQGLHGCVVIDDTYNANLASFRAGIQLLTAQLGTKILVMGDIAELEHYAQSQHQELGAMAKDLGVDYLLGLGPHSLYAVQTFGDGAMHFAEASQLIETLKMHLNADATVLVKGSRSSKMENIVQEIVV